MTSEGNPTSVAREALLSLGTPPPPTHASVVSLIFKSKYCDATPHSNGRRRCRRRRSYFACCRARKPPPPLKDRPTDRDRCSLPPPLFLSAPSLYPSNAPPSHSLRSFVRSLVLFLVVLVLSLLLKCELNAFSLPRSLQSNSSRPTDRRWRRRGAKSESERERGLPPTAKLPTETAAAAYSTLSVSFHGSRS